MKKDTNVRSSSLTEKSNFAAQTFMIAMVNEGSVACIRLGHNTKCKLLRQ